MAFRRPGNWCNKPSAGPPRGYFVPQNVQLWHPSDDGYYDDPIEEEIGKYMRLKNRSSSNVHDLKMDMRYQMSTPTSSTTALLNLPRNFAKPPLGKKTHSNLRSRADMEK
jgi:hypothetical protein